MGSKGMSGDGSNFVPQALFVLRGPGTRSRHDLIGCARALQWYHHNDLQLSTICVIQKCRKEIVSRKTHGQTCMCACLPTIEGLQCLLLPW